MVLGVLRSGTGDNGNREGNHFAQRTEEGGEGFTWRLGGTEGKGSNGVAGTRAFPNGVWERGRQGRVSRGGAATAAEA